MNNKYLDLMVPFYTFVQKQTRYVGESLAYYGTGDAGHWSIQSNFNVTGALGVLADLPQDIALDKSEVLELALKMFRYNLAAHQLGDICCTCNQKWGGSWISVLGLERMTAGELALEKYFTAEDREKFRNLRLYEADWLLKNYEVVADISGDSGKNKPESNYWNGSFLYRTAMDYPDAVNREEYLEKSYQLLLNAISHPADSFSAELFRGKALKDWHIGANFTEKYSLDHHSYMNVGYMIITLSHAAYLYLYCKLRNYEFPAEAMLHVKDLWEVTKNFIFHDGRLLRIGGDSRARYCYCQMYLLPVLLMTADLFHDADAPVLENNMLDLLKKEQIYNQDGSFFGNRLLELHLKSRYYYTRLESDPFAALGFGAYWHQHMQQAEIPSENRARPIDLQWASDYHGAVLQRSCKTVRSVCYKAAAGAAMLALPEDSSDLAEWGGNGLAKVPVIGYRTISIKEKPAFQKVFNGGFIHSAVQSWQDIITRGEGKPKCKTAQSQYACAALPDGKSMIVLEKVTALVEHPRNSMRSISWKIPNDVHNKYMRTFYGRNFSTSLRCMENRGAIDTASRWLNVDNKLTLLLGYGAESLKIYAPSEAAAALMLGLGENDMPTLYLNEICAEIINDPLTSFMPNEVMADTAYAVIASCTAAESSRYSLEKLPSPQEIRAVRFTNSDGKTWCFAANFSDHDVLYNNNTIPAGECMLDQE